jgi:hypothetical protein
LKTAGTGAALRALLQKVLDWEDAHAGFDAAVAGLPAALRGSAPPGLPHSPWQLLASQTYLRELLLVADHNAYHVGQLVLTRRLLGAWKG